MIWWTLYWINNHISPCVPMSSKHAKQETLGINEYELIYEAFFIDLDISSPCVWSVWCQVMLIMNTYYHIMKCSIL